MVPKDESRRVCIACQAYARQCTQAVEPALQSHPGRNLVLPLSNHVFLKAPAPNHFLCLYNENNKPTKPILQISSVVRRCVGSGVLGELETVTIGLCSPRVCHRVREMWLSMQKGN